jgi:hypothetical protein
MRKKFDCVESKHRAQDDIVAETAGMSVEEELAYWRRHEEAWRAERKRREADAKPAPSPKR